MLKIKKRKLIWPLAFILAIVASFAFYNLYFWGKIYPGISIAGYSVGGKTLPRAASEINDKFRTPGKIIVKGKGQTFEIPLGKIGFSYDFEASSQAAYQIDRTGNIFYDFYQRAIAPFRKVNLGLRIKLDEQKLAEYLSTISAQVSEEPIYPSVKSVGGDIAVLKGNPGSELDAGALRISIGQSLAYAQDAPVFLSMSTVDPSISDVEAEMLKARAEKLVSKSLILKFEFQSFTFYQDDLFEFLDAKNEYRDDNIKNAVAKISGQVNRAPQEPVFVFEGGRVKEFAPAKDGAKVKEESLAIVITGNLRTLETNQENSISVDIPITSTPPKIRTSQVNNLGIKELIGRGTSRFAGSISNRIYNIGLASSRFKGVLVAPGDVLSFNDTLGDVSNFTGFKQAYIIKEGKTILGDGGGVCQVSTTLFRAALNAGLPIVERVAHAYRVGYYEQDSPPGFDATVYSPSVDLKIKNDTPAYILIQTIFDAKNATLVFEIYGTKDGRVATTSKPVSTKVSPPGDDIYQDDPSLPKGTLKQTEYKAWGGLVSFNYKVQKGAEVVFERTFLSNYQPWANVFLRGTGPAK